MKRLSEYVVPGGIFLHQAHTQADQVIGLLADHLERRGVVRPSYAGAVKAREAIMPTGLPLAEGFAVAVPHTDPEHVLTSGIALAVLDGSAPFCSMDDPDTKLPVRVVFALALRSKDEQIEMLQAIGGLLQNPAKLKKLTTVNSIEEALALLDDVS
jgi:PTS system galactitol-specific IIA component